jgi:enoyl-CoA hydratase/carnithine racemase
MTINVREIENGVLVEICRSDRKGALSVQMLESLLSTFEGFPNKNMVLTGFADSFCSGLDLKEMSLMSSQEKKEMNALYGKVLQAWLSREEHKLVFMNGPAIGGGVGLVFAADYVVTTDQAWFCLPELTKGLKPVQIYQVVHSRLGSINAVAWFSGMKIDSFTGVFHGVVQERTNLDQVDVWLESRYAQIISAYQFLKSMAGCSDYRPRALSELFV